MRLPFSTTYVPRGHDENPNLGWPVVWDWAPPRRGTILLHDENDGDYRQTVRVDWPGTCFATVVCPFTGVPVALYAYAADSPPRGPTDHVLMKAIPGARRRLHGWVCLGDAADEAIRKGEMTPIEAFYNTSFNVLEIIDTVGLEEFERRVEEGVPISFAHALEYQRASPGRRQTPASVTPEHSHHALSG